MYVRDEKENVYNVPSFGGARNSILNIQRWNHGLMLCDSARELFDFKTDEARCLNMMN
jgi:hypothetical protein